MLLLHMPKWNKFLGFSIKNIILWSTVLIRIKCILAKRLKKTVIKINSKENVIVNFEYELWFIWICIKSFRLRFEFWLTQVLWFSVLWLRLYFLYISLYTKLFTLSLTQLNWWISDAYSILNFLSLHKKMVFQQIFRQNETQMTSSICLSL